MGKHYHAIKGGKIKKIIHDAGLEVKEFYEEFDKTLRDNNISFTEERETQASPIRNYKLNILNKEFRTLILSKKLHHGGASRSKKEQRIQTPKGQANQIVENNNNNQIGLLMSYYKPEDISLKGVFIIMKPNNYQEGGNVSRQVNIEEISKGIELGFNSYKDKNNNTIIICNKDILKSTLYKIDIFNEKDPLKESIESEATVDIEALPYCHNRIIFGAPGTGKSFKINKEKKIVKDNYERITFHPSYTYSQFVGTYKPTIKIDDKNEEIITYSYVPGPFIRILINSLNNPGINYILIIEELNRAEVSSVFGDIFQLLDRNEAGESEYCIAVSEELKKYLQNKVENKSDVANIRIPKNMYIWATMNNADQGVFPLDTAFKRRWNFEYIDIDYNDSEIYNIKFKLPCGTNIAWNKLRKTMNDSLIKLKINEDRLLGTYFIPPNKLDSMNDEEFNLYFQNKILMYLFEDVGFHYRNQIFSTEKITYSNICKDFNDNGLNVFKDENILELMNKDKGD